MTENVSSARSAFIAEVVSRFGLLPSFFASAAAAPGLIEQLWQFAKAAYLENPLPSIFKERLFVHLSRFCAVRYCIIRHSGFLLGLGRPAGDRNAAPESVAHVIALLSRPLPDAAALSEALTRLEQASGIPGPRTQTESDLFDALTNMFVEPRNSERSREAVRRSMGPANFEWLTAYLAFIRTAHYWTETHPELPCEPDMVAMLEQHPALAALLLDPADALADITARKRAEDALRASEERQAFVLQLSDALRPLSDPFEIQGVVARRMARQFGVSRANYAEVEIHAGVEYYVVRQGYSAPGLPSMVGRHATHLFPTISAAMHLGRTVAIDDTTASPALAPEEQAALHALQVRSFIMVPLVKDGVLVAVFPVHHDEPRAWSAAEITLVEDVAERTWAAVERTRAEAVVAAVELRQRALIEGIPQLVWRAAEPGRWTWASPQWTQFTGQREADSHDWGWLEPVHPDDRELARQAWARAEAAGGFSVEFRLRHAAESTYRSFQTRATPVRASDGAIIEWLGTSTDIDDLRALQRRQEVLVAELQHRTRNLFGVVLSIAERTLHSSDSLENFGQRYRDRISAVGRVQGLLSRLGEGERVGFDELVRGELAACGAFDEHASQVKLEGPADVGLRAGTVQTLAMALHELATNAMKYGALKYPSGSLTVRWRSEPAREDRAQWLHVDWQESGVVMPTAGPSAGGGHGRELIERALPYQLGATTTFELGADGVHCTIVLPIAEANWQTH